ncbi:uridine kinase family protein [Streptomyces scopuliridis]|uniref:uridine kinase family protein n=1 Tax=Streptomyces scopuliridis TaxID=452529 RepID=UPI003426D07E
MNDLTESAAALRGLPPSCGPVRLVAVDGHAGSGKSTFATRLSAELDGAPVLRLDDLATHEQFFAWVERMGAQVIEPLSRGASAHYAPYDWTLRRFTAPRPLPAAPVVIIEGVGAGRRALRPYLARLFWMDRGAEGSWERGRRRDGPGQSSFWDAWTTAETRHFAADPSRPFADALVTERQMGYVIRTGPLTTARTDQTVTQGDRVPPPY